MIDQNIVTIYTDGACVPNPGSGGYGVVLLYGKHRRELSGGFRHTTNNRMELYAAIAGLEALAAMPSAWPKEPCTVRLYSDSEYLVNAFNLGWINTWQRKKWRKVKNPDLWKRLLALCELHRVGFTWVQGHAGQRDNERCDQLAYAALRVADLPADENYESGG
jgi:ribonuclease HI